MHILCVIADMAPPPTFHASCSSQELLAGTIDNVQQAVADSSEHDLDRAARQARTTAIAPDMQHPLCE